MPRQIYANENTPVFQAYVNHGGEWKHPQAIYVNDGGVWKQAYPAESGSISYTTPGTYLWQVPMGITSITASVYAAGGGGGAPYFPGGDGWVGGGGSSGGFIENQVLSVLPGTYLQIVVGAGGAGGVYSFGAFVPGVAGGNSAITGWMLATGGGGGGPGLGTNGPAGSPGGTQGQQPCTPALCGYGYNAPRAGGVNGTAYGAGGAGGYFGGAAQAGGAGAVFVSWTATT